MVFAFLVLGCVLLILLWGCIYFAWQLYLLGHSEHGIAVVDEIVKGTYYHRSGIWAYTAYVRVTYQGEHFREKMKFASQKRIVGFALGHEIPVTVSRSSGGKVRVFQYGSKTKMSYVILVVVLLVNALMLGLGMGLALSATLSH